MILIVDDDPEILDIMSMNLEESGLEVETTVHPKQATSIIESSVKSKLLVNKKL